jgi:hypothetical protein
MSFVSTLPVPLAPGVPLAVPPASVAVAVSGLAVGASLAPFTVTVTCVVASSPPLSCTV